MKNFFLIGTLLLLCTQISFAQSYTTAGGIRLGSEWGLTLQQRVAKRITIEGILQSSFNRDEATITGLVEKHFPLISKRFNVYTGAGLHKGWTTSADPTYENPFGITGILGAEFTIGRLNISYDFKPAINISGGEKNLYMQSGVSARYVFVKQKVFNDITKGNKKKRKKRKKKKNSDGKFWEKWL